MPLQYDDEPGSWGRLSEGWPQWNAPTFKLYKIASMLCGAGGMLPYGSYVCMQPKYPKEELPCFIRCEKEEYVAKLEKVMHLIACEVPE